METINHEYYVSREVAKLLKEAGFDWKVNTCRYNSSPDKVSSNGTLASNFNGYAFQHIAISAPTLDVAQRWLREVKNIDVVVSRAMQWKQFYYTITHEENRTSKIDFMSLNEDLWWFKYEEALEAGIQKALELILEKGE